VVLRSAKESGKVHDSAALAKLAGLSNLRHDALNYWKSELVIVVAASVVVHAFEWA
jgi:hypothetical protein